MSSILESVDAALRVGDLAKAGREQRELELTQAEKWARDPVGWINEHVYVASFLNDDEGVSRAVRPTKMTLFPDQVATIEAWIDLPHLAATGQLRLSNLLIEKSRQIGETWLFAAIVCWFLHYHRLTGVYVHQRRAEVADRGWTPKSFFGRVAFINERLAAAKIPGVGQLTFLPFSSDPAAIVNPRTGAMIYGESKRDDPGRGQTLGYAIVDETARVEHGEAVHAALKNACPEGKAYLSTPNGDDNIHARLADEKPRGWKYLRLHWSTHPVYSRGVHVAGELDDCELCQGTRNGTTWSAADPRAHRYPGRLTSPWYEAEASDQTDEQVAAELDIDRERSLAARVYTEFVTERHVVEQGIPFEYNLGVELAVDYGLDTTAVLVIQHAIDEVRVIGLLEMGDDHGSSATPENVARELRLYLQELGLPEIETTPFFTAKLRAIGDPAGHARATNTGKPWVSAYRRQGFSFGKPPRRMTARVEHGITAVKLLLAGTPKPLLVCGVNAADFATRMRNHVWPTDGIGRRVYGATRPVENVHSHACDAFRYWVCATFQAPGEDNVPSPGAEADELERNEGPLQRRRRRALHGHLEDLDEAISPDMAL